MRAYLFLEDKIEIPGKVEKSTMRGLIFEYKSL